MRSSMVLALAALLAVAGVIVFLMRETRGPDPREPSRVVTSPASEHAELVAALDRLSKEVEDLLIQLKQVRAVTASAEVGAASRAGVGQTRLGTERPPAQGEGAEIPLPTSQIIRSKLIEKPDS
jgi:hypothetical protein